MARGSRRSGGGDRGGGGGSSASNRPTNISSSNRGTSTASTSSSQGGGGGNNPAGGANNNNGANSGGMGAPSPSPSPSSPSSWSEWCYAERHGLAWVATCAFLGALVGLGIGTGHLTGSAGGPSPWRDRLGSKIRAAPWYDGVLLRFTPLGPLLSVLGGDGGSGVRGGGDGGGASSSRGGGSSPGSDDRGGPSSGSGGSSGGGSGGSGGLVLGGSPRTQASDRSHPRAYYVLREMIVREDGGYVHPDLGLAVPAPCGASRGLVMVSDGYTRCQTGCFPGSPLEEGSNATDVDVEYYQEEVLLRIPISVQLTRTVAIDTLTPIFPAEVLNRSPLSELNDATLLVLLLAHERGRGRESRYQPYIATLPRHPTCGYSPSLRASSVEAVASLGVEVGLDVNGWPTELIKAHEYAERIGGALARDYGHYVSAPRGVRVQALFQWALCHVASRAVAGSSRNEEKGGGGGVGRPADDGGGGGGGGEGLGAGGGKADVAEADEEEEVASLRLVPMMDMINHDVEAGGFVELSGRESVENGDFLDATEDDAGTFVVRSLRHGRHRPLRRGQELMANYNVPGYSPLDWFINLGFVPPERSGRWTKLDGALPRVRERSGGGGGGGGDGGATSTLQMDPHLHRVHHEAHRQALQSMQDL